MKMFSQKGYIARFVGGVVRNALLGETVGDLDIATDALPQTVMELAQKAGFKAIGTGLDHGTVTVVIGECEVYEITTLRVDMETDGRHADVAPTNSWREDAQRRDFTMNALYVGGDGTVFDPLGGYDDLMARKVRFIGDPHDRIKEDYLRILRFFRFSAQYGKGTLDETGLAACTALQKGLAGLSRERIGSEFLRLLPLAHAAPVLHKMFEGGFLERITGRVPHMSRFDRWLAFEQRLDLLPPYATIQSEVHDLQEFVNACTTQNDCALHRLGALFMLVREDADCLMARLRLSNAQKVFLRYWVEASELNVGSTAKEVRRNCHRHGQDCQRRLAISWLLSGEDLNIEALARKIPDAGPVEAPAHSDRTAGSYQKRELKQAQVLAKPCVRLEKEWCKSDFTMDRMKPFWTGSKSTGRFQKIDQWSGLFVAGLPSRRG